MHLFVWPLEGGANYGQYHIYFSNVINQRQIQRIAAADVHEVLLPAITVIVTLAHESLVFTHVWSRESPL